MESESVKMPSNFSLQYEVPLGYCIEDVHPNCGIEKFRFAGSSNLRCVRKPSFKILLSSSVDFLVSHSLSPSLGSLLMLKDREISVANSSSPSPISPIGFEGYEKRLEITFFPAPVSVGPENHGLRALSRPQIDSVLDAAHCKIVSQHSNESCDSYLISESSLFVYPFKIILKTCGTTKPLLSVPAILDLANGLSLRVQSAKYSRGTFFFPGAQPAPYHNFTDEVTVLDQLFGSLSSGGKAYVIGDPETPNRTWHIYYATEEPEEPMVTLEMCMTGLNKDRASIFFKDPLDGDSSSVKKMTRLSGISDIIPEMDICDFEFEPCGYSMNGIHGPAVSTIHVTPEEGFSYASYEAMGFDPSMLYGELIERVLRCFEPSDFSVAVTIFGGGGQAGSWGKKMDVDRYACQYIVKQELPGGGLLMYQNFSAVITLGSPRLIHTKDALEDDDKMLVF